MMYQAAPFRRALPVWEIGEEQRLNHKLLLEARCPFSEDAIRGYFDYMAKRTDTLWENDTECASCNQGFASHVLVWLDRLGYLKRI